MNLVKTDINPPKSRVVIRTTTNVELTRRELLGDKLGLICKESAKAIAPRILPLNQMRRSYLKEIRMSKEYRQIPTKREGRNTPTALAKMQEKSTANMNTELNFSCSIP